MPSLVLKRRSPRPPLNLAEVLKMKRSLMPIMAIIFAFASFVSVVTPASACWWGKDKTWHDGR